MQTSRTLSDKQTLTQIESAVCTAAVRTVIRCKLDSASLIYDKTPQRYQIDIVDDTMGRRLLARVGVETPQPPAEPKIQQAYWCARGDDGRRLPFSSRAAEHIRQALLEYNLPKNILYRK